MIYRINKIHSFHPVNLVNPVRIRVSSVFHPWPDSLVSMVVVNGYLKLITRKSYGFRTQKAYETALYHSLGALPEPEFTHEFC